LLGFGIQAVAVQLQKGIVDLQFFCVVLGDWVSLNQEKVGRGAFSMLGVGGVLGQFYTGYETLYETL
jgi:hypothetical protein